MKILTCAILPVLLGAALGACSSDNSEPAGTAGASNSSNNSGGSGSGGSNASNSGGGQASSASGSVNSSQLLPEGFIVGQACYVDADKRCPHGAVQAPAGTEFTEGELDEFEMIAVQGCAVQDGVLSDQCPTDNLIGCCTPEPTTSLVDGITGVTVQCHYEGTTNTNAQTQCEMGGGTWTGEDL
jgi:hypothetical protein